AISVGIYEEHRHDLLEDFCRRSGIDSSELETSARSINRSAPTLVTEMLRHLDQFGRPAIDRATLIDALEAAVPQVTQTYEQRFYSARQRRTILDRHAKSNAWVAQRVLHRERDMLFEPPRAGFNAPETALTLPEPETLLTVLLPCFQEHFMGAEADDPILQSTLEPTILEDALDIELRRRIYWARQAEAGALLRSRRHALKSLLQPGTGHRYEHFVLPEKCASQEHVPQTLLSSLGLKGGDTVDNDSRLKYRSRWLLDCWLRLQRSPSSLPATSEELLSRWITPLVDAYAAWQLVQKLLRETAPHQLDKRLAQRKAQAAKLRIRAEKLEQHANRRLYLLRAAAGLKLSQGERDAAQ
ncbi:MAG: hypothetical protein AAGH19_09235, partial [Pseudomonadota bacterium]